MKKRLAIITTHPIQYNSPWFALLSQKADIEVKVFYTWSQTSQTLYDKDFGQEIKWDIPLLTGYKYQFAENRSKKPDGVNYNGIDCPSLNREVEKWGATHILVIGWNLKAHLKAMRYFKGKIPVWFRGDSTLIDEQPGFKQLIRRLFLTWVYSYVDRAFYVGSHNREYFIKHGLKESQLTFTPHSIDNDRFSDDVQKNYELAALQWRRELGFKDSDFVILFCGKFETKKNPLLLLTVIKEIHTKNTNSTVKLLLVGNGVLEDELKALSNGCDYISFLPFQNQTRMPLVYRLANLYCLPSQGPGETWGLAVNEAMACGRPVLVSDKVGCAADLVNAHTGLVFQSGDCHSLSAQLKRVVAQQSIFSAHEIAAHIQKWSFRNIVQSFFLQMNENGKQ